MKIKLSEAKGYQVRKFAIEVLGLDVKPADSLQSIKAKIAAVWDGDEIEIGEEEAPLRHISMKSDAVDESGKQMVKVIIQKTSMPGGSDPVWLAVNGRGQWVPRGEAVEISAPYFEVLENAKEDVYDRLPDGGINPVPRQVPVYPYQRVS